MKKNLIFCRKKETPGFVVAFLAICLFAGCGKDDKSVTSVVPPSYFTTGVYVPQDLSTDNTHYLTAVPTGLTLTAGAKTAVSWTPPALTTNLTSFRVYVVSPLQNAVFIVPSTVTAFTDGTDTTTGYTYAYSVTSVFTILDTTYNFYTEVESLPSAPQSIAK